MFEEGYGLRELFDNKTAQLKNKGLQDYDDPCFGVLPTMDSTFLGPVLWEDTLPISDLDNINLEEFSPEVLECSATVVEPVSNSYLQNNEELGKVLDLDPLSSSRVNLNWTGTPANSTAKATDAGLKGSLPPTRKKSSVPVEQRTEKYWSRRMKNNASAKRSRDARRMLENQVHMKATALERENEQLRLEMMSLVEENKRLRALLSQANICLPSAAPVCPRGSLSAESKPDVSPYSPILPKGQVVGSSVPVQNTMFPTSCLSPSLPPNVTRTSYNEYCQL